MNKEDYVSLEVAKKLKEKCFDELCKGCTLELAAAQIYGKKRFFEDDF